MADPKGGTFAGLATVTAALGVGVAYATGALFEATRLHGAHVQVSDTLPLFPLPNLLTIGITVGVRAFVFLISVAALVALIGSSNGAAESASSGTLIPVPKSAFWRGALYVFLGVGILISFSSAPPLTALGYVVIFGGGVLSGVYAGTGRRRHSVLALCAAYVVVVGINLAGNYAHPQPLPVATAIEADGTRVSGLLLLHTDGVWYLSPSANRVIGVEDASARSVRMRLRPRTPQRSLARTLWDLIR